VLAWAVEHVIGDNASDTLEGVFQLLAATTLFYVSSWMTARNQARRWTNFIDAKVVAANKSRGPALALAATAFLAVMREGAETIVFFQALAAGATETVERHAVMMGVVAGALALAIAFLILRRVTYLIPIGPIFTITSILLYVMAVIFAGQGIASFQESGVISATFVSAAPTIPMLGVFPTIQTLAAQMILLTLALAALLRTTPRRTNVAHPPTQTAPTAT
jgi:high-affinity iron transporter